MMCTFSNPVSLKLGDSSAVRRDLGAPPVHKEHQVTFAQGNLYFQVSHVIPGFHSKSIQKGLPRLIQGWHPTPTPVQKTVAVARNPKFKV